MLVRAFVVSILTSFVILAAACAGEPPDQEIQLAQTAVDAAKSAGADRYAVEEFTAAEDALKRAREAVAQRDYRLALNNALDSRDRAQQATRIAASGQTAARTDAERSLSAASTALADAQAALKAADAARPAGRGLSAARLAVADAERRVQEARTAFGKGDYVNASTTAAAVTQAMAATASDLDGGSSSPARRRR